MKSRNARKFKAGVRRKAAWALSRPPLSVVTLKKNSQRTWSSRNQLFTCWNPFRILRDRRLAANQVHWTSTDANWTRAGEGTQELRTNRMSYEQTACQRINTVHPAGVRSKLFTGLNALCLTRSETLNEKRTKKHRGKETNGLKILFFLLLLLNVR